MLPGHDGTSNIVYDEAGTIYCYDKVSDPPIRRRMAYIGYEPKRGTIKYRCPAMHYGLRCKSHRRCNGGRRYGKTVRVKWELDLRRFPPIPRATKKFERLYGDRGAVERVNARLRLFWGVDDGNVTGAGRFHARVAVVMRRLRKLCAAGSASPPGDLVPGTSCKIPRPTAMLRPPTHLGRLIDPSRQPRDAI